MTLCREWTLVKQKGDTLTAEPLKCRCWTCEYCKPIRSRQLRKLGYLGKPDTFLTLTVNPAHFDGPDERARQLVRAWRNLRRRAMRKYGYKSIPFLAVFERTKKGEPHLHVLMRVKWLEQSWISEVMDELIGAPIVDIRRVKGARAAAAYVAKYVGKDPTTFEGAKRYWRSRDWLAVAEGDDASPASDGSAEYRVFKGSLSMFAELHRIDGRRFTWDGPSKLEIELFPKTAPPLRVGRFSVKRRT